MFCSIQKDGGLRVPPNMARLFEELPGADKFFEERATTCTGYGLVVCSTPCVANTRVSMQSEYILGKVSIHSRCRLSL